MTSQTIQISGTMTIAASTSATSWIRSAWSGKSSMMPSSASPRATSSRNCCRRDEPGADDQADDEHQRRVAAVAGPERVAHPHDVPLAGGVAPRQPVVLGDDRQLVGGALGEPERGGVGRVPGWCCWRRRPTRPRSPAAPSTPARTASARPARGRACVGRWARERIRLSSAAGDERRWPCATATAKARDGSESATASASPLRTERHHRNPLSTSVTIGGPTASDAQRRLLRRCRRASRRRTG